MWSVKKIFLCILLGHAPTDSIMRLWRKWSYNAEAILKNLLRTQIYRGVTRNAAERTRTRQGGIQNTCPTFIPCIKLWWCFKTRRITSRYFIDSSFRQSSETGLETLKTGTEPSKTQTSAPQPMTSERATWHNEAKALTNKYYIYQ